uniref:Integrase catalytic domain-containing protein n=1 Tax=Triticum urartu TaxID=4572 RepID=A0A8R7P8F2_TRIUA
MTNIYKYHGLPHALVSNRDRIFTSKLWRELFRQAGTELRMSSAYHPQTDGTTERVNQCLESYLRCFVHACPHRWFQWLHQAEFWYNTSKHSTLGASPFETLYGHPPRHFGIVDASATPPSDLVDWMHERALMTALLKQQLERARQRMKDLADKHRSERSFTVGDWVFVKLQPYVQVSVAERANHKLSFCYFGPFQVLARVGAVAYRLQLPASSKIHPVFHMSLLRGALPPTTAVEPELPNPAMPHSPPGIPKQVLARRVVTQGAAKLPQVLIKWTNQLASLASWEDYFELRSRFPGAAAWGQADSEGGENVTDPSTSTAHNPGEGRPRRKKRPSHVRPRHLGTGW